MAETEALTPKAKQTREHILATALSLFAENGYGDTTLRDIAAVAEVSLGLTYRYFARKEELILALYERLAGELADEVRQMPPGPLAHRFATACGSCLQRLTPHREALGALFSVGLSPNSEVAVLGDRASGVRDTVWGVYRMVISGASDRPKARQEDQLTTVLYAAHLLVVLFWLQDRSSGQSVTGDLLRFAQEMIGRMRPVLGLPPVAKSLARLTQILDPLFGPSDERRTSDEIEGG